MRQPGSAPSSCAAIVDSGSTDAAVDLDWAGRGIHICFHLCIHSCTLKRVRTHTMTISAEAKINIKWTETASESISRGLKLHDLYAEFDSVHRSCICSPSGGVL